MQTKLDGLGTTQAWFSYLGTLKSCLEYLGNETSRPWLYGGTGLAFTMNMAPDADPAGPIAWDVLCVNDCSPTHPGMVSRLSTNLGFRTKSVCACAYGAHTDTEAARKAAWDLVRGAIDEGLPCIVHELEVPSFSVVNGYDETGYLYLVPGENKVPYEQAGPAPWAKLGNMIGWVHAEAIVPCDPAPDEVVVRDALRELVERMGRPNPGSYFIAGLDGYEAWASGLERGQAQGFGHRYNTAIWLELRQEGVTFLKEAKQRLPGRVDGLIDEALGWYEIARSKLAHLHVLHPPAHIEGERIQSDDAAQLLREARQAEEKGLPVLGKIAEALG